MELETLLVAAVEEIWSLLHNMASEMRKLATGFAQGMRLASFEHCLVGFAIIVTSCEEVDF